MKKTKLTKPNIEMDAKMVLAGMKEGMDGIINWGFAHRSTFTTTGMVTDRCKWLKKQSENYIKKVCDRVVQLEKN